MRTGSKLISNRLGRVLETLCLSNENSSSSSSCFCVNSCMDVNGGCRDEEDDYFENKPLVARRLSLKDVMSSGGGPQTLALHLKPKTVVLKVSMHCNGCARRIEKHVSKIDGVTSYKVDLETKMVVVIGDILPFEVLESVSKVKNAQLWTAGI